MCKQTTGHHCLAKLTHKIKYHSEAHSAMCFFIYKFHYFFNYLLYPVNRVPRRRQWHPTPVLLPGKSHGWRSLVGCSPRGRQESDTTEWLHFHFSLSCIGEGMAPHSSVLAWRILGTGEPGGLLSMGSHRVGHDWSDLAAATEAEDIKNRWQEYIENLYKKDLHEPDDHDGVSLT